MDADANKKLEDLWAMLMAQPPLHCEVCVFLDDETCHRPVGRATGRHEQAWNEVYGEDGSDEIYEWIAMEERLDVEWSAYLLGRHGLPSHLRIVDRRPTCIRRQRIWLNDEIGYCGPKYVGSCNGYVSGKD